MKRITVIMSVYDEPLEFLKSSIDSILKQSFKDFEFIIVNDNPCNMKLKAFLDSIIQKDSRIIIISNDKNIGLTRSLNKAIYRAKSKYIARMDADDISENRRLEVQFFFLEKYPEYVACGTWAKIIDECAITIGKMKKNINVNKIKSNMVCANQFIHPSLMIRKEIFNKIGLYDESLAYSQDYDLLLRLLKNNRAVNIPQYLLAYRRSANSITSKKQRAQQICGIRIRFRAVFKYGYSPLNIFCIFFRLCLLFVPIRVKKMFNN